MGIPLVALMGRQPQILDYGQQLAEQQQLQAMRNQNAMAPGQLQMQQLQLEEARRQMAERQAINEAYKNAITTDENGQPQVDINGLSKALSLSGHGSAVPAIVSSYTDMQKARQALVDQSQKIQEAHADLLGHAGLAIQKANYEPGASHAVLRGLGNTPEIQQLHQLVDSNAAQFKQMVDSAVSSAPFYQKVQAEKDVAEIRAAKQPTEASLALAAAQGDEDAQVALGKLQEQKQEKSPTEASLAVAEAGGDVKAAAARKLMQAGKIQVAAAEGAARARIEAEVARGANTALANVPPHLIPPATAAATKAGEEYAAAKSVTDRMSATMDAARKGNVVSYQIIPQEGTLQLTTSQGVHRINRTEIEQYAGGGSLWQRLEGHIGKQLTGKSIPASVLNDMADIQKIQAEGSKSRYENALKTINQYYGSKFQPVEMAPMVGLSTNVVRMKSPTGQIKEVSPDQVEFYKSKGATVVQ